MRKILLMMLFTALFVQHVSAYDNEEFRSVWVITWEHSKSSDNVESSKARIRTILDNIKAANMNAVLWQVRQGGTAYYNSSFEPWGSYSNGPYPGGYDILTYAIEEAHKRGLELHAWFNVFAASSTASGTPGGEHPEWVCRDRAGSVMQSSRALSPGLKDVRDYTINAAMEVVRNYDIDGLHLDYVRWNEHYSSANSGALSKKDIKEIQLDRPLTEEEAEQLVQQQSSRYLYDVEHPYSAGIPAGYDSWEEWWRWSVTEFVRTLHDSVQSVKPWVRLSPAALGKYRWSSWQGYGTVYQDAGLWFNEGYVDQLTPMHYHWTSGSSFLDMLNGGSSESWRYWIQPGIAAGRLFSAGPGSYKLAESNIWYRHKEIVESARTVNWLDGFQFFSYGSWQEYRYWEKASNLFFTNKTKMRAAKFLNNDTPAAPSLELLEIDSLNYQITITPPAGLEIDQWFAVYRSEDDTLDTESDEIIDIHFGQESYSAVDTFSGNQDFNGQYTYFASTLNRYWNESDISNSELSALIPSFAPVVSAIYPLQGDSLPVNEDLVVYFSKTMDPETFQGRVHLVPEFPIQELKWSNGDKNLTINFQGNLDFNSLYTLTISDSAADVNGLGLDGNSDGGSSEPFVYQFRTLGEDKAGPKISYSNMSEEYLTDEVDIQNVLTVDFNELLDHESVSDTNVQILRNDNPLTSIFMLNDVQERTIVSLQPVEPFGSLVDYKAVFASTITDTAGNPFPDDAEFMIRTEGYAYADEKMIDDMRSVSTGIWEDPEYSGSTKGTIGSATSFVYNDDFYLPAADKRYKKHSAELNYEWDPGASEYLLREYCSGGTAKTISFDTSYTLQVYIFGDGSGNEFRFSLKEVSGSGYPLEVSKWYTIDWTGWKILEWDLSDPNTVGTWLGNEIMDGSSYNIDSYQLTHPEEGALKGRIFFKNLRAVKKEPYITDVEEDVNIPQQFQLSQNYPNPFNPETNIDFVLPAAGKTSLSVYNMLGQKVKVLFSKMMPAGSYSVRFNARGVASGIYGYELRSGTQMFRKRMVLLK